MAVGRFFGSVNRGVESVVSWIALFGLLGAVFTSAARRLTYFGALGWPEAIFLGLGASSIAVLTLTAALIGWRQFRPVQPSSGPTRSSANDTDKALVDEVQRLSDLSTNIINDYQRMLGLEARFEEAVAGIRSQLTAAVSLAEKLEAVRVDVADLTSAIKKVSDSQDDHRDRAKHSFFAIGARERLSALESTIKQDASDLYNRLKAGETYDQTKWQQWENVHSHWRDSLDTWLDTGRWYALAVKYRTLSVDDAKYGLDWSVTDTQFPNAEAVRRFKKFRIIHTQWEDVVPDVKSGLEQVAFTGLTESEVRGGRPAG